MAEGRPGEFPDIGYGPDSQAGGYFAPYRDSQLHQQDSGSDSATPQEFSTPHDSSNLVAPTSSIGLRGNLDNKTQGRASNSIDASGVMSEYPNLDQPKSGSSNRRRSRLQHGAQHTSASRSQQPQNPNYDHAMPSSATSENLHNRPPSAFQGTPINYAQAHPSITNDSHGSSYTGQYTMTTQSNPMTISSPPYPVTHGYRYAMGSEMSNMSIHVSYPNILQPQAPLLSIPRPSLESSNDSQHSFHGPLRSSPIYHSPSPNSHHSTPPSQASTVGTAYIGFPSVQYPTAMMTSQYPYTAQTYPPSPIYSPQFPSPSFSQHYTSSAEGEPQRTWFYSSHPPMQYYDANHYQNPYPSDYSQVRKLYPVSPFQPIPSQHSDNQSPSDSARPITTMQPSFRRVCRVTASTTQSTSSNTGSDRTPALASDQNVVRRSYHPNPPAHRSEWVMWAGNVPSDASHDELWKFLTPPPPSPSHTHSGVLSIFLILRSNCAFINYDTEENLKQAIARFNGVRLRAHDTRCPRLLCRVRRKDDDLRAGVGGQRGLGMHTNWVKEQKLKTKGKDRAVDADFISDFLVSPNVSPTSVSDHLTNAVANISISSGDAHGNHSSSSGSFTSTNSGFLAQYFPRRYFILKSLTQEDLDLSVARAIWATQKHNEEILDQAYRSSRDVFLIFSVNKSGEFYGYARMAGPIQRGEQRTTWSSRSTPMATVTSPVRLVHPPSSMPMQHILPPGSRHFVEKSPEPIDSSIPRSASKVVPPNLRHSAPAILGEGYHLPSGRTIPERHSLDYRIHPPVGNLGRGFVLDSDAPTRAMRAHTGSSGSESESGSDHDKIDSLSAKPSLRSVEEEEEKVDELEFDHEDDEDETPWDQASAHDPVGETIASHEGATGKEEEMWGDAFAVQWISTHRVPFHRTKHLRNPWNHDREIKISRDGTELEPSVGRRLVEEWAGLEVDPQTYLSP